MYHYAQVGKNTVVVNLTKTTSLDTTYLLLSEGEMLMVVHMIIIWIFYPYPVALLTTMNPIIPSGNNLGEDEEADVNIHRDLAAGTLA